MDVKPGFRNPEKVSLSPELRCPLHRGNRTKGTNRRGSTVEWNGLVISLDSFAPMRPLLSFEHDGFRPGEYPAAKGQLL